MTLRREGRQEKRFNEETVHEIPVRHEPRFARRTTDDFG